MFRVMDSIEKIYFKGYIVKVFKLYQFFIDNKIDTKVKQEMMDGSFIIVECGREETYLVSPNTQNPSIYEEFWADARRLILKSEWDSIERDKKLEICLDLKKEI